MFCFPIIYIHIMLHRAIKFLKTSYVFLSQMSPLISALIISGTEASTYVAINPLNNTQRFSETDMALRSACCVDGNFCDTYFERRPILRCSNYTAPAYCKLLTCCSGKLLVALKVFPIGIQKCKIGMHSNLI